MIDFMNSEPNSDSLISELESLGISASKLNELNDVYEVENLVEHLKQTLFKNTNPIANTA